MCASVVRSSHRSGSLHITNRLAPPAAHYRPIVHYEAHFYCVCVAVGFQLNSKPARLWLSYPSSTELAAGSVHSAGRATIPHHTSYHTTHHTRPTNHCHSRDSSNSILSAHSTRCQLKPLNHPGTHTSRSTPLLSPAQSTASHSTRQPRLPLKPEVLSRAHCCARLFPATLHSHLQSSHLSLHNQFPAVLPLSATTRP